MKMTAFAQVPWLRPSVAGRLAVSALFVLAAASLPSAARAQGTQLSGKEVVDTACASCHASGAQGAPRIGDRKAWSKRAAQGLSSLSEHAIQGIRAMPPHGGNPGLSEMDIKRAITYMVNQSGGKWAEPIDPSAPPAARTGEAIVKMQCAKCHQDGKGGAPRIGDRDAWIPRLKNGLDNTVRSAMKGHGGMPARGGMADLTDAELRSAVIYLFRGPEAAR
jgi:cytochrome c5